jgi:hypothetical protein
MYMPHDLLDPNPTNTVDFIMMASRAYSKKNTWYIEYEVTGPPEQKGKYAGEVIQIPAVRGTAKSTNHKSNVLDLIKQIYPKATTLADIAIAKATEMKILQSIAEYSEPQSNPDKEATRTRLEAFVHETRASEKWQWRSHKYSNDRRKIQNRCIGKAQKRLSQHQSLFGKRLIC